ncbi:hypothetical protein ACVW1A_004022 [Bradyrhizobium sp. LB1.3]
MRSSVIAAMIAAAMTSGRRAAPLGSTVISGAVVTAALFANLGRGVNAGVPCTWCRAGQASDDPSPDEETGGQSEARPP